MLELIGDVAADAGRGTLVETEVRYLWEPSAECRQSGSGAQVATHRIIDMKILIAGKSEELKAMLASGAGQRRYSITEVVDGRSAIEWARKLKPDMILSGAMMPDMDGCELCQRIRNDEALSDVIFVLISNGSIGRKDVEYARATGVTLILKMPEDPESLVREIEMLAQRERYAGKPKTAKVIRLNSGYQGDPVNQPAERERHPAEFNNPDKEALESKEEQLHLITDSLPEMMAEVDTDFRYLYVNKALAKTFGFLQKTVRGVHVRDVLGRHTYAMIRSRLVGAVKGEKASFKIWIQIEPGNSRYVWLRLIPRTDSSDKTVAVVMFMSDITHMHEVETALRERESLLSSLLSNVPLVLFSINTEGMITVSEGAGLALLGGKAGEDVGRSASSVYQKHPRMLEYIDRALKGERFEAKAVLHKRELDLIFTPQANEEGELVGTICLMLDQSERARLEREVATVSTLEQKRIGQDLHDSLGQLLTGISLLSKALEGKLIKESSPVAGDAQRISALAAEATRITKQAVTGLLPVVTEENGLQMALETLVNNTKAISGISFRLELDAEIPDLDHQHATQIYLILSEAVSNSIKHAGAKEIVVGSKRLDGGYEFFVKDVRSGDEPRQMKGGGKGLNIMEYRSRMIGAHLEIDWRDSGTRVSCFLPVLKRQTSI